MTWCALAKHLERRHPLLAVDVEVGGGGLVVSVDERGAAEFGHAVVRLEDVAEDGVCLFFGGGEKEEEESDERGGILNHGRDD